MTTAQESLKLYLPPADAEKLRQIAKEEERPLTVVLRRMVREFLEMHDSGVAA